MLEVPEMLLIDGVMLTAAGWLLIGITGLCFPQRFTLISRWLFPLGAVGGLLIALLALAAIVAGPQTRILPIGLPDLPFHLRLDALSAFFLFLLGAASAGISIYAAGYLRPGEGYGAPGLPACSITFF